MFESVLVFAGLLVIAGVLKYEASQVSQVPRAVCVGVNDFDGYYTEGV